MLNRSFYEKMNIVKTITLDRLCKILDCNIEGICEYIEDEE